MSDAALAVAIAVLAGGPLAGTGMLSTSAPLLSSFSLKTMLLAICVAASTPSEPTRFGAPKVFPPSVDVNSRSPPSGSLSQQVPWSTTILLADGANTSGVPKTSSPDSVASVTELEHVLAPRARTHTKVAPVVPLATSYATTRLPFGSIATLPEEVAVPSANGLSSG